MVNAFRNWPININITGWTADSVEKKIRVFEQQLSFENWECAKISLRQKVASPESAKISLRQNFSFYSTLSYALWHTFFVRYTPLIYYKKNLYSAWLHNDLECTQETLKSITLLNHV